jgi:D-alanine-D-alanine ligase-like ATP-grasp enzyme
VADAWPAHAALRDALREYRFRCRGADLGLPLIVKPAREGSSIGLTKVVAADQMRAAFEKAAGLDADVIAETFIDGAS